jgi:hypothetical protein
MSSYRNGGAKKKRGRSNFRTTLDNLVVAGNFCTPVDNFASTLVVGNFGTIVGSSNQQKAKLSVGKYTTS